MRWSLLVVVALLGCSGREPTPDQGLDAKPTPAERTRARAAQLLAPNHVLLGSGTKVGFAAARTLEGSGRVLEERLAVVVHDASCP